MWILPPDFHRLRWQFVKDGSSVQGQDRAWLDQVVYTPGEGVRVLTALGEGRIRRRDERFQFTVYGQAAKNYEVQTSIDLGGWLSLGSVSNVTGSVQFVDQSSVVGTNRYYRVLELP